MNKDILLVIETVSNEKNVKKDIVIEAIEEALKIAVKKKYRLDNKGDHDIDARVSIDRESGGYTSFRRWKVVDEIENLINNYGVKEIQIEDDIEKLLGMENNTKNTDDTSGSSSIESFVLKKIKEN